MRPALIATVVLFSATASAQQAPVARGAAPAVAPRQTQPAPPPAPTVPSRPSDTRPSGPPLVLPLPPLAPPPTGGLTPPVPFAPADMSRARDLYSNGRRDPYRVRRQSPLVGGYVGGYLGEYDSGSPTAVPPAGPSLPTGQLRLSVTPDEAQVLIDGYYVGTVADVDARPLTLDAGPHRLELRAPAYQTVSIDVRIAPNETVTYRASLDRTIAPPPPRTAAAAARADAPMYLIPNCYLGNVPPRQSRLPAGCDIKRVQVLGRK